MNAIICSRGGPFWGLSSQSTVHSRSCPSIYISNVYNTWTLNTQTFSFIKCIDLSIFGTLYITHTQPLPILSWHSFFEVQPLWTWFQTQGCIYLYNWDLCPSCCPGSSSTRCPSSVSRLLSWLILNKGCLNLNCWSTSCCSPPWWQVGSYIHYILYVNCAGFRYQTRLLFLAAASLWFGN